MRTIKITGFEIHKAQVYAGLLLLAFAAQCVWMIANAPSYQFRLVSVTSGESQAYHSAPLLLIGIMSFADAVTRAGGHYGFPGEVTLRWGLGAAGIAFGLWLGAGLWWVARRLFDDAGGYAALILFCFSPIMLRAAVEPFSLSGINVIAAWGLFGTMYTAIGVAHTIYAPPRYWRVRPLILALAMTGAVAADLRTVWLVPLALLMMWYLAPGKRPLSAGLFTVSLLLALLLVAALFGFQWDEILRSFREYVFALPASAFLISPNGAASALLISAKSWLNPASLIGALLATACLVIVGVWRRARYFGNIAPLLIVTVCACLTFASSPSWRTGPIAWAVPFVCVFVGGVTADLQQHVPAVRKLITAWLVVIAIACLVEALGPYRDLSF